MHYDTTFTEMIITPAVFILQIFYIRKSGSLELIVAEVVNDFLVGGRKEMCQRFIEELCEICKVRTTLHLSGNFSGFGRQIEQDVDFQNKISAEAFSNLSVRANSSVLELAMLW